MPHARRWLGIPLRIPKSDTGVQPGSLKGVPLGVRMRSVPRLHPCRLAKAVCSRSSREGGVVAGDLCSGRLSNHLPGPDLRISGSKLIRFAITLLALSPLTAVHAQHTSDDPLASASDAFGLTLGLESIGLYSPGGVRGFNPQSAGNIHPPPSPFMRADPGFVARHFSAVRRAPILGSAQDKAREEAT